MDENVAVTFEPYYPPHDRWYEVNAYPSPDGLSVYFRDVTGRKRAEEALRESEERFRASFRQAAVGVALVGMDHRTLSVNPGLCAMLGYSEAELRGRTFIDVSHPDDLEAEFGRMRPLLEGEVTTCRYEKRYLHKDGSIVWGDLSVSLARDAAGAPKYVVGVVVDITERKKAEEGLRAAHAELEEKIAERTSDLSRANEFLRALLESIQDGIVACDGEGVLTLFNRATQEFHGLPTEPLPADRWAEHYDLYRADGRTRFSTEEVPLFRALRGERVQGVEMVIAPRHGPVRTLLASGKAFQDE
jgi:PAS domain S-box-containing protein